MRGAHLRNDAAVTATVYGRALLRAAELLGGREKLARVLRVPASEIDKWIGGETKPPRDAAGSSEHYRD